LVGTPHPKVLRAAPQEAWGETGQTLGDAAQTQCDRSNIGAIFAKFRGRIDSHLTRAGKGSESLHAQIGLRPASQRSAPLTRQDGPWHPAQSSRVERMTLPRAASRHMGRIDARRSRPRESIFLTPSAALRLFAKAWSGLPVCSRPRDGM